MLMMEVLRLNNEEKNKQQGIVKLFVLKQTSQSKLISKFYLFCYVSYKLNYFVKNC